jgi:membrane-bound metal-dependent hydrolase YbcI (DUF457 family)
MKSEGTRRLSILVGIVSSVVLTMMMVSGMRPLGPAGGLLVFALLSVLWFFIGWGAVRLVAWVVEGFRKDKKGV